MCLFVYLEEVVMKMQLNLERKAYNAIVDRTSHAQERSRMRGRECLFRPSQRRNGVALRDDITVI